MDDNLFDDLEVTDLTFGGVERLPERKAGGNGRQHIASTAASRERYRLLKTKRLGD